MVSATAGALLAVSLSSTPLLQSKLSPAEAAIFNRNGDGSIASGTNLSLPKLNRPVNILVLGTKVLTSDVDTEAAQSEILGYHALLNSFEGLSDTMLLIRFDPKRQKLTLLSIPRDTLTNVPGLGQVKINEANAEGGPALAAQSVSDLLNGVGIDRYIRVNVQAIEKMIDAMGGVEIYVPKDMKYQDDSQHLYINLKEGKQRLNGDQVLQFLRFRYDDRGDIGRVQRQQMLMRAFIEQALTPAAMTKLPKVLNIVRSHLDTNLSVEELFALVNFAGRSQRSDVQMLMVPGSFSDPEQYRASYWLPNYEQLDPMVSQYFDVQGLARPSDPGAWGQLDELGNGDPAERLEGEYGSESSGATYTANPETNRTGRTLGLYGHLNDNLNGNLSGAQVLGANHAEAKTNPTLRIAVQNSTGEELALNGALDQLTQAGYGYVFAQEDWSETLPVTRIVARRGDLEAAKEVQRSLGLGEVIVDSLGDINSDITVLLGRDWMKQVNRHSAWHDTPAQ